MKYCSNFYKFHNVLPAQQLKKKKVSFRRQVFGDYYFCISSSSLSLLLCSPPPSLPPPPLLVFPNPQGWIFYKEKWFIYLALLEAGSPRPGSPTSSVSGEGLLVVGNIVVGALAEKISQGKRKSKRFRIQACALKLALIRTHSKKPLIPSDGGRCPHDFIALY
jgi:hypothetical protein